MSKWRELASRADWLSLALFSFVITFADVLSGEENWMKAANAFPEVLWFVVLIYLAFGQSEAIGVRPLRRILSENDRYSALVFLLFSMMAWGASKVFSLTHTLYLLLVGPIIVWLFVWTFERLVPRPPFAPFHRLALALPASPISFFVSNAF